DLERGTNHRGREVLDVQRRHDAGSDRRAQVDGELVDARAEDRLVEHRADRAAVAAHEVECLGVGGQEAEVLAVAGFDELHQPRERRTKYTTPVEKMRMSRKPAA